MMNMRNGLAEIRCDLDTANFVWFSLVIDIKKKIGKKASFFVFSTHTKWKCISASDLIF